MPPKPRIELLVTDLDNTLYDWVGFFAKAFAAMVDVAVEILQVDREQLLNDLQAVHQRHHDSERPWSLAETNIALARWPGRTLAERKQLLDQAFHVFNRVRKQHLKLYPGVADTLAIIREHGVPVVGHTEASAVNALHRIEHLNLASLLTRVYAKDSGHALDGSGSEAAIKIVQVPRKIHKPDPRILLEVCGELGVAPDRALYVGDSLTRDVSMARQIGMQAAWAAYGTRNAPEDWAMLVRVTHWTREDVQRVKQAQDQFGNIVPDVTIEHFADLLEHFEFQPRRNLLGTHEHQ
jgi:FMN phosphatase YigB (HAD superfamily)